MLVNRWEQGELLIFQECPEIVAGRGPLVWPVHGPAVCLQGGRDPCLDTDLCSFPVLSFWASCWAPHTMMVSCTPSNQSSSWALGTRGPAERCIP